MKHSSLFIGVLLALGLVSCNQNVPEWREQYREASCTMVNFIPEAGFHRLEVMLVPNSKGEYRMRDLSTGGTCREFIIGRDPFIKVDSNAVWHLADWKWNLSISLNHVTIPLQWTDVQKPDNVYVRSDFETSASNIINRLGTDERRYLHRPPCAGLSEPLLFRTGHPGGHRPKGRLEVHEGRFSEGAQASGQPAIGLSRTLGEADIHGSGRYSLLAFDRDHGAIPHKCPILHHNFIKLLITRVSH